MFGLSTKMGRWVVLTLFAGTALATLPIITAPANADEITSSIARGGLIYDKWYMMVGLEGPDETHPAYPSDGQKAGADTWRCKECHGWDYRGVDGAYSEGSHYTGIIGVSGMLGVDPADIIAIIKDDTHAIGDLMDEAAYQDLALFLSQGQLDTAIYIDAATKAPIGGNIDTGEAIFNTICSRCHREDGTRPKDMHKTLGKQMGNPWEVMHKIMNGHPGQAMPSMRAFGPQVAVDVMTYIATLPTEK